MADLQFQAVEADVWFDADQSLEAIVAAMRDDLNTPQALAILSELATRAEDKLISATEVDQFKEVLKALDELLGLDLHDRQDITTEQKELIAEREIARRAEDWTKSDEIRQALAGQGVMVRDTSHGPIWHR